MRASVAGVNSDNLLNNGGFTSNNNNNHSTQRQSRGNLKNDYGGKRHNSQVDIAEHP